MTVHDFGFDVDDAAEAELAHLLAELPDEPVDQAPAAAVDEPVETPPAESAGDPVDEAPAAEPVDEPQPEAEAPPTIDEVRLAAEELAMLEALKSWVTDECKTAKERHKDGHARYVNAGGNRAIPLRLPNGAEIGTWNIAEATSKLVPVDEAVLAYVTEHSAHNLYEVVDGETAARYDDVVEFIRLTHPELITTVVRPAYVTSLLAQLDNDGNLLDDQTGEVHKLAKRVKAPSDGSGKPGWKRPKGKPDGKAQLVAAWRSGEFKSPGVLEAPPAVPAEN